MRENGTAVQNRRPPREKYDAVSIEQNGGRGRTAADPAHRRDRYVASGRGRKWCANFVDNRSIFVMKALPTLRTLVYIVFESDTDFLPKSNSQP